MKVKNLNTSLYQDVWQDMKQFTLSRNALTEDEMWLVQHPPVYTQGQAGKPEHVLNPQDIPIIQTDRGGQITYHGPGQIVAYYLMDIKRINLSIRTMVQQLEQILIDVLAYFNVKAHVVCGAPGVYVGEEKIASIGLRVKNGRTYHGIALNVDMNLMPFKGINPCGFDRLEMTQLTDLQPGILIDDVETLLIHKSLDSFQDLNHMATGCV